MIKANLSVRVVFNDFPKITAAMKRNADRIVGHYATLIEAGTKVRIINWGLVDTGALVNSVQAGRVRDALWRVTVGQFYGVFHEFGTRFLPAKPSLIPEFEHQRGLLVEALRTGVVSK